MKNKPPNYFDFIDEMLQKIIFQLILLLFFWLLYSWFNVNAVYAQSADPDPPPSLSLLSNSSLGLEKGEGYYKTLLLGYHEFGFGLTDHWSIGVSGTPILLLSGGNMHLSLMTKVSVPVGDYLHLSGKVNFGTTLGQWEPPGKALFGIYEAGMTVGGYENNIGLNIGQVYLGEESEWMPFFSLNLNKKLNKFNYLSLEGGIIAAGEENISYQKKYNKGLYTLLLEVHHVRKSFIFSYGVGVAGIFGNEDKRFWGNFAIPLPVLSLRIPFRV